MAAKQSRSCGILITFERTVERAGADSWMQLSHSVTQRLHSPQSVVRWQSIESITLRCDFSLLHTTQRVWSESMAVALQHTRGDKSGYKADSIAQRLSDRCSGGWRGEAARRAVVVARLAPFRLWLQPDAVRCGGHRQRQRRLHASKCLSRAAQGHSRWDQCARACRSSKPMTRGEASQRLFGRCSESSRMRTPYARSVCAARRAIRMLLFDAAVRSRLPS